MTLSKFAATLALLPLPLIAQQSVTLTIGGAARLAVKQSGAAAIAQTRIDQADARVRQAKSALFPTLSASAGENERNQNTATFGFAFKDPLGRPVFDPNGQILPAVKVIDLRGRMQANLVDLSVAARLRNMRSQVTVTAAEGAVSVATAATQAATAYVRAARADAALGARYADSTLAAELLGIASEQVKAGVGVALDVTRARSQLAASRAQLIAARNERERSRLELRRILGLDGTAELVLADSLMALPLDGAVPSVEDALRSAVTRRPDILSLNAQKRTAEQMIAATRLERLPSLGLYADQGATGKSGHLLNTYTWGLQVSLPVFDGFRREGRLQEQHAQVHETEMRLRDLEAQAAIDVRGALLDLATAREQLGAADERLALAQQELDQARERFKAGVSGNADVITASLGLNAARTMVVDARAAFQGARVTLAKAQGAVTDLP